MRLIMEKKLTTREANDFTEKSIDDFLNLIVEEKKRVGLTPIQNPEKYKIEFRAQFNLEIAQVAKEFSERIKRGFSFIWDWMKTHVDKASLDEVISKAKQTATLFNERIEEEKFDELVEQYQSSGSISKVLNLSDATMNHFYKACFSMHEAKNYDHAADGFYFLCAFDAIYPNYWIGYGHSEQHLGHFEAALYAYATSILLDIKNPIPHYFSAQCYDKLGKTPEAIHACDLAIERATGKNYANYGEAARTLKNKLKH